MFRLKIQEASESNLKGMAQLIRLPREGEREPLGQSPVHTFYGKLGKIECSGEFEFGICSFRKRELKTLQLEQHLVIPELLFALDSDFVTPLAPVTEKDGKAAPDFEKMIAIRIRENSGIILGKGVYHFALWPQKDNAIALVGFQKGLVEGDIVITDLDEEIEMYY